MHKIEIVGPNPYHLTTSIRVDNEEWVNGYISQGKAEQIAKGLNLLLNGTKVEGYVRYVYDGGKARLCLAECPKVPEAKVNMSVECYVVAK